MSGLWLWLPVAGPIRASTVIAALAGFLIVTIARHKPWRALVAVLAWSSLFETVYHAVGFVVFGWPPANIVWMTAALAGWVVLAGILGIWPDWRVSIGFASLMAVWAISGFHSNVPGQSAPINVWNEMLNESAKTTLGLAYLIGALRRSAPRGRGDTRTESVHESVVPVAAESEPEEVSRASHAESSRTAPDRSALLIRSYDTGGAANDTRAGRP